MVRFHLEPNRLYKIIQDQRSLEHREPDTEVVRIDFCLMRSQPTSNQQKGFDIGGLAVGVSKWFKSRDSDPLTSDFTFNSCLIQNNIQDVGLSLYSIPSWFF